MIAHHIMILADGWQGCFPNCGQAPAPATPTGATSATFSNGGAGGAGLGIAAILILVRVLFRDKLPTGKGK